MMKRKNTLILLAILSVFGSIGVYRYLNLDIRSLSYTQGIEVDSLNGIPVYHHEWGKPSDKRRIVNGYNTGLEFQCVEFVKRYYFLNLGHRMSNPWGHAKSFFQTGLPDGHLNKERNLKQFTNPSSHKPAVDDLLVFAPTRFNPYGHVAIVSAVSENHIETISQNPGVLKGTRERISLKQKDGKWVIGNKRIMGWLRK
ncbi:CHAP domain-containing protein [Litoribacter ruber]|uniref:CHAP domain-containing protein n=1 Tax=Litoribacter ruber TaxID=702568 RepID=UPI001BDA208A|nr:CHAP domain-containing protein [Litoribacter ruber]MBT0812891.1 CHAP domain-containing protein [Litoribacter ruber]